MNGYEVTEQDRRYAEMYRDFLPEKVIDAHMHLWAEDTIPMFYGKDGVFKTPFGTVEDFRESMKVFFPGVKEIGCMVMPMPDPALADESNGLREKTNRFIAEEVKKTPESCCMSPYILPGDTEEKIADQVKRCDGRGLKVYGMGTGESNIAELELRQFIPEAAWVVAEKLQIPIILHVLKSRSMSDPENYAYLNRMTEKYPDAPLVLAHCARSFVSWTGIKVIRDLADHGNIWFDMSAICEPGPMMACILKNAAKRTMWGSDYPNNMYRGRAVTVGFGQNWLLDLADPNAVLLGEENLMAFYQAALLLNLDQTQIEDIFYGNAKRLYFKNRGDRAL